MTGCAGPLPLFNPVIENPPLTGFEVLAGPLGIIFFLPLAPLLRYVARWRPRGAVVAVALLWLVGTLGPAATAALLCWLTLACGLLAGLRALRRREILSRRATIAAVWIGNHLLILPFWWLPAHPWYGWDFEGALRTPVLHAIGFAYFLFRFIAWGVAVAENPAAPLRLRDTIAWLLYPACMRNGPVLLREDFLARLEAWNPRGPVAWREAAWRFVRALAGGIALAVVAKNTPRVAEGMPDFFAAPGLYPTSQLLRLFYLVPIQIYLFLWTYNEFAIASSIWIGLRVDENFDWLPKATSVRDFWRRWHITVGAWLRRFIYIPLGGNRGLVSLHYLGVFVYCGVWHGASWSFVAWGASQGLALAAQRWWDRGRERLGWRGRPSGALWTAACWLATMHYQIATIVVFADFAHCGSRLLPELVRRLAAGATTGAG